MERPGDVGRSIENLTDGEDWLEWPYTLTRGGEVARAKKVVDRLEKVEVDEAKDEAAEAIDGERSWKLETPWPLDLVFDGEAMAATVHEEREREIRKP